MAFLTLLIEHLACVLGEKRVRHVLNGQKNPFLERTTRTEHYSSVRCDAKCIDCDPRALYSQEREKSKRLRYDMCLFVDMCAASGEMPRPRYRTKNMRLI